MSKNGNKPKQFAPVKVQADRWPLTEDQNGDYIATIIIVAPFKGKPTTESLCAMLVAGVDALQNVEL
jgi:hypothetical protein